LFVTASLGAAADRLHPITEGGVEDLIQGVFLDGMTRRDGRLELERSGPALA
jgi:hypothetical protein